MINVKECFPEAINSPVRSIRARVELFEGSTLLDLFCCRDRLKNFTIERIGENSKFFGFGICHRLNVHLIDPYRDLNITTANSIEIEFGVGCEYMYPFPAFYVTEVHRDENTNELSITAYDKLYTASAHYVQEIEEKHGTYTIKEFTEYCGTILGLPIKFENVDEESFNTLYPKGANFEGTETIRDALNDIAEATQTIYFINSQWELTFKRLDISGEPVLQVDKEKYITLKSGNNRRLSSICSATQLGDNIISSSIEQSGTTQYVRDNPFWDLRDDITSLVEAAIARVGGMTINQFDCSWRGNFALEIGDKIGLTTKDDEIVNSYILNDVISYNGSLSQRTQWNYIDTDDETFTNPSNIGDAIKYTYAKVDKINKNIEIVASEVDENKQQISSIQMNTESIAASVQDVETSIENVNNDISTLTKSVEAKMTAEDLTIAIKSELATNGAEKVVTSTGFRFDETGLDISKSGSELHTQITEDGMTVYRNDTEMLVANNEGVNATNLNATTYLIIGGNSRFENYGYGRTGCFWIG